MTSIAVVTMTVYLLAFGGSGSLDVSHHFTDTTGHSYWYTSTLPGGGQAEYHLRDIGAVPEGFSGYLQLSARAPFTAYLLPPDAVSAPVPAWKAYLPHVQAGW